MVGSWLSWYIFAVELDMYFKFLLPSNRKFTPHTHELSFLNS